MSDDSMSDASLEQLWRAEVPEFDARAMRQTLEDDARRRRRGDWLSVGVQAALIPVIGWMDLRGAFPIAPGTVVAILIAGLALSVLAIVRARRPAAVPASPARALDIAMISKRRLRRYGVFLASALPLGLGGGYGIAAFLDDGASRFDAPTSALAVLIAGAAFASVLCAIRGISIAQDASHALATLEERRRALEQG